MMTARTEDITYIKENGYRIAAKLYLPEKTGVRYRLAIFAHGFGGNYRELEHYGERFADRGLAILFFDFCGGGVQSLSDGDTRDMCLTSEYEDYMTVLRGIKDHPEIDPEQIYLMGESQGGYEAALVGAEHPEGSAGLILWYPAFCISYRYHKWAAQGVHSDELWGTPIGHKLIEEALAAGDILDRVRGYSKPVLLIHGDADRMVPISYSEEALKGYPNGRLKVIPGGEHGFEGQGSIDAGNAAISFILEQE